MAATLRITWPLLSLSFLFLSICSNTNSQTATSVMKNTVPATSGPSAATTGPSVSETVPTPIKKVTHGGVSGVLPTRDAVKVSQPTGAPTTAVPTAAVVTTPAVVATSKLPDTPNSAGPQVPTVKDNPSALPVVPPGPTPTMRVDATAAAATTAAATAAATTAAAATHAAATRAAAAATTSPPKTTGPVATADSSGGAAFPHNAATGPTPKASATDKTSWTRAPAGLPGNAVTVAITKAPTLGLTSGQQSGAHTTIATATSPRSIAGAEKTTMVLVGSRGTAAGATQPAGNSSPSTRTKAGPTPPMGTGAGTTPPRAPIATATTTTNTGSTNTSSTNTRTPGSTAAQLKTFLYSLNHGHEKVEEKDLVELCKRLMVNLQDGNCTLTWRRHNDKTHFDSVEINGKVKTSLANQFYEDITRKPTDNKTLIAILASCGALLIMIVILAVCASHHRKPYNNNQQHLTEELHTVENGYHDNPTLEVMEVQPEMQEKKVALNGEFNDSWIVPIDNLLKEDVADEEDTHL